MLADNIVYLKKNNQALYKALKEREDDITETTVIIEDAKNNEKTLRIKKEESTFYLHSKYNPQKEAELIIDRLVEREIIKEDTHVIFYGLGLGYHVEAFLKRYPKNSISIFEPSVEVLSNFLDQVSLNSLPVKQIVDFQCEYNENVMNLFLNNLITSVKKQSVICVLPTYLKVFEEEYQFFLNRFSDAIKSMRNSIHTNYAFKKRWILNSVVNFKEVLTTPNILMENKGKFKSKTAILVSAGPSLEYEIENLRLIKEKGLALIFCAGSAINSLLYNDIYPDAMCTYDPRKENQLVLRKIIEMGITSIPMIFGSSVGCETWQEYKGPKYYMITSQDTVSRYFLKDRHDEELITVSDAGSIAVVTLELLCKLGFKEVILVGQNLAYLDKKYYAEGQDIEVNVDQDNDKHLKNTIDTKGNIILTNETFNSMKKQMEACIKNFNISVINTTRGGAQIAGTRFMPMEEVLKEKLNTSFVNGEEFKNIVQSDLYDQMYMKMQLYKMRRAFETYHVLLSTLKQQILKINELVANKNERQAIVMHKKLDHLLLELEANDFAKVFTLPMNRVEHEILIMHIQRIKKEKNELRKIQELTVLLNTFINLLYGDSQLNQQIMNILTDYIGL